MFLKKKFHEISDGINPGKILEELAKFLRGIFDWTCERLFGKNPNEIIEGSLEETLEILWWIPLENITKNSWRILRNTLDESFEAFLNEFLGKFLIKFSEWFLKITFEEFLKKFFDVFRYDFFRNPLENSLRIEDFWRNAWNTWKNSLRKSWKELGEILKEILNWSLVNWFTGQMVKIMVSLRKSVINYSKTKFLELGNSEQSLKQHLFLR